MVRHAQVVLLGLLSAGCFHDRAPSGDAGADLTACELGHAHPDDPCSICGEGGYQQARPCLRTYAGICGQKGWNNGPRGEATFDGPTDVALAAGGVLYVADSGNNAIRKVTDSSVSVLAGDPAAGAGTTDGVAGAARFSFPLGLTLDEATGRLLVADNGNKRLRAVELLNRQVSTISDTEVPDVAMVVPWGKNLLVTRMHVIEEFVPATEPGKYDQSSPYAGAEAACVGGSTRGEVRFNGLQGIAVHGNRVAVASKSCNQVIEFNDPDVTVHGSGHGGAEQDGAADKAEFVLPTGVAYDKHGTLWVTSWGEHSLRKISADGVVATVISGEKGHVDGPVDEARLGYPAGLAIGEDGVIYIADSGNDCIRVYYP